MNYLKKASFCFLFLLLLAKPHLGEAARLHAIIVTDTIADSLANCMKISQNKMTSQASKISAMTGLELNLIVITGEYMYAKNIFATLDTLDVQPDDVIIFYCNAHGYNTPTKAQKSIWPNIYLTVQGVGVDFEEITNILHAKKPRLLVSMADSCNKILDFPPPLKEKKHYRFEALYLSFESLGYKKLFLEQKGLIMMSSSIVDTYAWGSDTHGPLFTVSFLTYLSSEVKNGSTASWDNLMNNVSKKLETQEQYPQWLFKE